MQDYRCSGPLSTKHARGLKDTCGGSDNLLRHQGQIASTPGDMVRQQHADHAQIGQLLEGIIMARLLAMRKFHPKVVESVLEKGPWPQLLPAGKEITPEMSAGNSGHEISQEVRNEQPSKKKMPPPPQSEIAPAWKRSPPWKGALYSVAGCIAGNAEDSRRLKCC